MISTRITRRPTDTRTQPETPVFLRLRMLEATHGQRDRTLPEDTRAAARGLAADLRRAIARTPSLTFADVVAKLQTAGGDIADASALDHEMMRSVIADLHRLPASA